MSNITVKKSTDKYPECNLCLVRENVYEIRRKDRHSGYVFQLCGRCLKDIHGQIIKDELFTEY